jgi:hypothetical protein
MRRPLLTRYDTLLLVIAALAVTAIIVSQGRDLRTASTVLGVATFALLTWRLVSTWPELTVLEHALAGLLAASPLVGALAQANLVRVADGGLPPNPWLWLVIAHRAACIVLVVFWTRWLGRRHSPFRRGPVS